MKHENIFKKILKDTGFGILGVLGTHIESKIGLAIFLLITSVGILFSPKSEDLNYTNQLLLGFSFLIVSIILTIWRFKEIRKNNYEN